MKCLYCGGKTKVLRTVKTNDGNYYRERACINTKCGEKYKTIEVNEITLYNVLDDFLPEQLVDEISNKLKGLGFFRERDTEY